MDGKAPVGVEAKRRIGWRLLILLWIWASLVFVVIDLFLNVPALDRIRPDIRLYEGMRASAHKMVGEPYQRADHIADDIVRAEAPPVLELLVLDVASDRPLADLQMDVHYKTLGCRALCTNGDGVLDVPVFESFALATRGRRRLVRPSVHYPDDRIGSVVWTYLGVTIKGTVTLEDEGVNEQDNVAVTITGAPIARREGHQGMSRPDEVGSMTWFERNAGNRGLFKAHVNGKEWSMEVPSLGTIGILGSAAGYRFASASVEIEDSEVQLPEVHLLLRRMRPARLEIKDASGAPIAAANVQYRIQRTATTTEINPHWGYLYRSATGQPYTSKTTETGAQEALTFWGTTDASGRVDLECPLAGNSYSLIIRARGFRQSTWTGVDPVSDRVIVMEHRKTPLSKYRFIHDGRPIRRGVLYLCEELDGGHSVLPGVTCANGWFECTLAERGVEYLAIFRGYDESGSTLEGHVVLGDEEVVYVSD